MKITPNPVVTTAVVDYSVTSIDANVNIKLIDVTGATVSELVNRKVSLGNHFVNINAENLSSGMYFVVSNINGTIKTTPVIIKK